MVVSLQAAYDLGLSIGVDDRPLIKELWPKFHEATRTKISQVESEESGIDAGWLDSSIGRGLRSDLPTEITNQFCKWAQMVLDAPEMMDTLELSDPRRKSVHRYIASMSTRKCYVEYYSLGWAFLRIDFDVVELSPSLIDSCRCLEWMVYRYLSPILVEHGRSFLKIFGTETNRKTDVFCRRSPVSIDTPKGTFDLVPGFYFVILGENVEATKKDMAIALLKNYNSGHELVKVGKDYGELHLGYSVAAHFYAKNQVQCVLIQYAFQLCQVFDRMLKDYASHLRRIGKPAVGNLLKGNGLDEQVTDELDLLALTSEILSTCDLRMLTMDMDFLHLNEVFESVSYTKEVRGQIVQGSQLLSRMSDIRTQRTEAMRSKSESAQANRVNLSVMLLAVLTIGGVFAESLNYIDPGSIWIQSTLQKLLWILIPISVSGLIALLFYRHWRK